MNTFLDLLVVVVMGLIAVSLLSLILMFTVKNQRIRHICFFIVVALSIYVGYVGTRILWLSSTFQMIIAIGLALLSLAAFIIERMKKNDEKVFMITRILASVSLVMGLFNAFM